jgi:hypothetical protein
MPPGVTASADPWSSPIVLGALITATAALIAAVIAGIVAWRNANKVHRLERDKQQLEREKVDLERQKVELERQKLRSDQKARETEDAVSRSLAVTRLNTTYSTERYETVTRFDEQGNGQTHRKWIGLRTTQALTDLKIPYRFGIDGPKAKIPSQPDVRDIPPSAKTATYEPESLTDDTVKGQIHLHGLFRPESGEFVGFQLIQPFEGGICTSRAEAQKAYKDDGWTTEYAGVVMVEGTRVLQISVVFPGSHRTLTPAPAAIVFIGDSEVVSDTETEAVKDLLSFLEGTATLTIGNPKPGFRYAIAWMPP